MTTIGTKDSKPKNRFWTIALVTLLVLTITTTIGDILDTNNNESGLTGLLLIPSMPGFLIYVLVTGDIHGWQPGPIGQAGRIVVATLGSWIFWTPLINWFDKRIKRK
jgi:hypothetical protein